VISTVAQRSGEISVLTPFPGFSSELPQSRHPERSASQIYRVTQLYGAESKDLCGAYFAHAVRAFSAAGARTTGLGMNLIIVRENMYP
jgi:hypothetical protein